MDQPTITERAPPPDRLDEVVLAELRRVRAAQAGWQRRSLGGRLQALGRIAAELARDADALVAAAARPAASAGEILASEVLPLAEACRYVARRGGSILSSRSLSGRDRAWWMGSIGVRELREPLGVVLIIGPANYPLLLPGVQLVQALAAGNGVLLKPAPGCAAPLEQLATLCARAGVPKDLVGLLPTSPAAAQAAIAEGVDKVVFTGSHAAGQAVACAAAESLTPAALELSGHDAVFVLPEADLDRVAASVAYALVLNAGQTCIAPRRIFATAQTLEQIVPRLTAALADEPPRPLPMENFVVAQAAVGQALAAGARLVCGELDEAAHPQPTMRPVVLCGVTASMAVAREDLFAPVVSLIGVENMTAALQQASQCAFALGASVFGPPPAAQRFAEKISAGCVTINDVIVPTADPRVSFGGWQASGYGVTRGLEGLREMSRLKVVCERRGRWLPHLTTGGARLATLMRALLLLRHGGDFRSRCRGVGLLLKRPPDG